MTSPVASAPSLDRLRAFFRWDTVAVLMGLAFVVAVDLWLAPPRIHALEAVVAADFVLLRIGRRQMQRGQPSRAVMTISLGLWLVVIVVAWTYPFLLPIAVAIGAMPIAVSLPFLSARSLARMMLVSLAVLGVAALASFTPSPPSRLPPALIGGAITAGVVGIFALVHTALRQFSLDLNDTVLRLQQALAATQAKSAFLADMSHETRTPLNAIIGYSEMLEEDMQAEGRQEAVEDLRRIQAAGKHLLMLVDDVRDLSRIEVGRLELAPERFSVREMIEEVAAFVRPMVRDEVQLTSALASDVGEGVADQRKLRQALVNLAGNAAKFTARGQIQLGAARDGDWLVLSVDDTGIGIAADDQARLFEPFFRGGNARRHQGTGLGLYISRRLCELMGGGIAVSSEVGRGSRFTIKVPAGR